MIRTLCTALLLLASAFAQTLQQQIDSSARYVQTPPGVIQLSAPLNLTHSGQTVDFSASTLVCNFDADCINVGGPSLNPNYVSNITLIRPSGMPTIVGGTHSFITVYGMVTKIENVTTQPGKTGTSFGHLVTVLTDQAFTLDGADTTLGQFNVRGSAIWAPGPFGGTGGWLSIPFANAAVGWLTHLNLNLQCQMNGVDWQSGNTLRISDSVIEGYSQFGLRTGTRRGGYGGIEIDNVYMEAGNCPAPTGRAGILLNGGKITIHGSQSPQGAFPVFARTGPTQWLYYVAINSQVGTFNLPSPPWHLDSVPLYLGTAFTDGVTPITGQFPNVNGAAVYRVLRVLDNNPGATPMQFRPAGTGAWLVATVLASSCTQTSTALNPDGTAVINGGVCSFTDAMTLPAPYTVPDPTFPNRDQTYHPDLWFWPGDLVLTNASVLVSDPTGYQITNTWRPGR